MPRRNMIGRLSSCVIEEDKPLFSLKDSGTSSSATINVKCRKCQKIKVDGCLNEIQSVKCDWCIRDKSNGECVFVELKGSDCKHGAKQILNTIDWFRDYINPFVLYKEAYIVVHGKIPHNKSTDQIIIARLAKTNGVNLVLKRSPAKLIFDTNGNKF